jgi:hypothetical protein
MAMAMTAVGAQGGGSFQGSDEWIRETLRRHEAKRRAREAARGAKPTVPFDRVVFTQHVQVVARFTRMRDELEADRWWYTMRRKS